MNDTQGKQVSDVSPSLTAPRRKMRGVKKHRYAMIKKMKCYIHFKYLACFERPGTGFPELQLPADTDPTIVFSPVSLKALNGLRKIGSIINWFE